MRNRLLDQHPGLFARALGAEQAEEGFLAAPLVLAQLLAGDRLVALGVEQVVGDLEGEAEVAGIAAQSGPAFGRDAPEDRAGLDRAGDQRAGLERLQPRDGRQVEARLFGFQVHHLPAGHARGASGARQLGDQLDADIGIGMRRFGRHHFERQRVERIAGEDRGRFIPRLVYGGLAAAQVVVVHRRQVVVDQRIDVDAFDRGAGAHRAGAVDAEQPAGREGEQRAQALAAADRGVAHRAVEILARIAGDGEQSVEQRVDIDGNLPQRGLQRKAGVRDDHGSARREGLGAGRAAVGIDSDRFDADLGGVEPRGALPAQLVATLVEIERILERHFAALEAADDPLQLLERFFEGQFGDGRRIWHCRAMRHAGLRMQLP